jgi:hypothetical protein
MLTAGTDYQRLYNEFVWPIPRRYNIGVDTCDQHADGSGRLALIYVNDTGAVAEYSFDWFYAQSNRFANALYAHGFQRGDRLAILLQQSPETAVAHLAAFKAGNLAEAQQWHFKLFTLCRDMLGIATNPIPVKIAMKMLGRDTGELRLPLTPLSESEELRLRKTLTAYGLL